MRRIETFCPILMVIFLSNCFNIALGGGSSDKSSSTSIGSYKTAKISASPERSAKYKKPAKGEPVDIAYEFFELNKEFFHINNPREELAIRRVESNLKGRLSAMVSFKQLHNGIELFNSDIRAFIKDDGELREIEGNYCYDMNLPSTPSVDSASAVKIALQEAGALPLPKAVCSSKPVIIPSSELFRYNENRLYMAWPVRVYPDSTEKARTGSFRKYYRYYIDALDGSVLQKGEDSDLIKEYWNPKEREQHK